MARLLFLVLLGVWDATANRFPKIYTSLPRDNVTRTRDGVTAGYYSWNWGGGSQGPSGDAASIGVSFTGLVDAHDAISQYSTPPLKGSHFVSLGGGNAAGVFNPSNLAAITALCSQGGALFKQAGYVGIVYDVEEVDGDMSMVNAFSQSFQACHQQAGLRVIVTTSHSAPYQTQTPDVAVALVKSWVRDKNIEAVSPQLYSSGQEGAPDFAETSQCVNQGCVWGLYKGALPAFWPSLVQTSHLPATQSFFNGKGIQVTGYIQWAQTR